MTRRSERGFTLIELMIVVAIIGVLASTALPTFQNMTYRARKAERDTILDAVARGTQALLIKDGSWPIPFAGALNPAGAPGTSKRLFDNAAPSWRALDLEIEGTVYYSYSFAGAQAAGNPVGLDILGLGDLDGDGLSTTKTRSYEVQEGSLRMLPEDAIELALNEVEF